jgi:hypothetical protein
MLRKTDRASTLCAMRTSQHDGEAGDAFAAQV